MIARIALVGLLALTGCKDHGDGGVGGTADPLLEASDQTLPVAIVGQPYHEPLLANAGTPPYAWEVPEWQALPGGLALTPDGYLSGKPSQAGTFTFQVEVTDTAGRTKRPFITLSVVLEPTVLACGDTASGVFLNSGYVNADPNLNDFGGHEWLAVELPDDDTTRIQLNWTLDRAITAYVGRPNEVLGSWDIEEDYVAHVMDPTTDLTELRIDASTQPSLSGYAAQDLLPVLAVAQMAGAWEVSVECSDGPIFVTVPQYPTELGQPLDYDFDVYDEPAGTRIYTPDPLPEWMIWDERTGQVTGTAEEVGSWPFTLIAETPDGRVREERSIIGVYRVRDITCGQTVQRATRDGYFDGEFTAYYDTDGYHVYRLPLGEDVHASAVELQLSDLDASFLGTADPDPGWLKFFPGAERIYGGLYPSVFRLDPRTYPAMKHYRAFEEIFFQVAPTGLERDYTLTVTCDDTPRPDLAGLPVIPIFEPVEEDFPAVGGQAPYQWSADGLPAGLQLSSDGQLTGSVGEQLESQVTLTVEDKAGAVGSDSYPLYSSVDAACAGDTLVHCGDTVTGTFTSSYFADPGYTSASTARLCLVEDNLGAVGFTVEAMDTMLRVDIADPGRTTDELLYEEKGVYVAYVDRWDVEGVGINPFGFPTVTDYTGMPIRAVVRAYEDGDWRVQITCE